MYAAPPCGSLLIGHLLIFFRLGMIRGGKKEKLMKRVLPVLMVLALAFPSVANAEFCLVRGSGPAASFESTARPVVAVKASPDLAVVAQGKMTVPLASEEGTTAAFSGTVWYCLSARDGAQLAVALADAGSRFWRPGIRDTNLEFIPVLYSCGSDKPGTVTQRVFIRPVQLDPWMPAFASRGMGWTAGVMVSQYEWIMNNSESKLLVEYREPCVSERCPIVTDTELKDFVQRADTAFSARFGENGDIVASTIRPYDWGRSGVSAGLLTAVLGSTMENAF